MLPIHLLASLAAVTAENWQIYAVLASAVIALIVVADKVDAIRHRNRQTPPLHDIYATKEDIARLQEEAADMEARSNRTFGALSAQVNTLDKTIQTELRSVNRTLGTIEGTLKQLT